LSENILITLKTTALGKKCVWHKMYLFLSRNVVTKHLQYLTSYVQTEYKKSCGSKHTDINVWF